MGHVRAGEALQWALAERGLDCEHVDILALGPRWVRAAYGGGFRLLAGRAPAIWRGLYVLSDGPDEDEARWGPAAHRLLFRSFARLLSSRRWSACVCTHFLPAQLASGRPGVPPFSIVVTDFSLHRYWLQPRVANYYVAMHSLAETLSQRLPGARVEATGIPIGSAFANAPAWPDARAALSLPEKGAIALVMSGSFGLGIEAAVTAALSADPALHVVAICGTNEEARRRLAEHPLAGGQLRVHGMVHDVERFVMAADVVVTKPGGLTSSEVLALGRPLILTRPIPGHEEENAAVLQRAGAALRAHDETSLANALRRLLRDPGLRMAMAGSARALGRAHAASDIARSVAGRLERRAVA
jgi:processive 1,2-diacylglycerol beta-glucosyltransferase